MLKIGLPILYSNKAFLRCRLEMPPMPGHLLFGQAKGAGSSPPFGFAASLGAIYFCGISLVAGALAYEHWSAARLDLAGINRAFFQSNAFVSAVFLVSLWLAL